mmetsp:Transcript_23983/g.66675  ORF Transcript_23983/g.66675 Transcript_23983/m.66675 type:complete len:276 (+) Transcript_23983:664-1491(+)
MSAVITSGIGEIFWSSGASLGSLYLKSPSARDKLRLQSTLWQAPILSTIPPAASIRLRSRGDSGLWSLVKGMHSPARHLKTRESPTLATVTEVRDKSATVAVHPMKSSRQRPFGGCGPWCGSVGCMLRLRSSSSMSSKAFFKATLGSSGIAKRLPTRPAISSAAAALASRPPWPSKTAKSANSSLLSHSTHGTQTTASSIASRQPCISQEANVNQRPSPVRVVFVKAGRCGLGTADVAMAASLDKHVFKRAWNMLTTATTSHNSMTTHRVEMETW